MAKFTKKIGKTSYYEIDGIRAGGLIPYFISNKNVHLLINKEFRNDELVNNIIGGKVDKTDKCIEETIIREFNEETGFLAFDKINSFFKEIQTCKRYYDKPKYQLSLINIGEDLDWRLLPNNYSLIFKNIKKFHDRDSEELKWINLYKFNEEGSYLFNLIINDLKKSKLFMKYNPNQFDLFVD
tara:strand:- start:521 stop:1069 length:549 start_codon:yes stop_codon:yes gene_type:complete